MPWTYSEEARRYRSTESGRFLSAASEQATRDDFMVRRAADVRALAGKVSDGSISVQAWEKQMRSQVRQSTAINYALGRGGKAQMTDDDWQRLADAVKGQQQYLRGFAQQLANGELSQAQIAARSDLYLSTAEHAYDRGRSAAYGDPPLPVMPGEDCEGMGRCRCEWQIDAVDDGWECTWIANDDGNLCDVCAAHAAEYNPLVLMGAAA